MHMNKDRFEERELEGKEVECSFCTKKFHLKHEDTVSGVQVISIQCPFCQEIFTADIGGQLTDDSEPPSIDKMKIESIRFIIIGILVSVSGGISMSLSWVLFNPFTDLNSYIIYNILSEIVAIIGGLIFLYGSVRWVSIKTILEMRNLE